MIFTKNMKEENKQLNTKKNTFAPKQKNRQFTAF